MLDEKQEKIEKEKKIITEISHQLFLNLGIKVNVNVVFQDDLFFLNLEPFDDVVGLLIGKKGKTLHSIQTIINLIYKNKSSEFRRIIVDIANWKEKEKKRLMDVASQAALRAIETNQPQALYNLTPAQRRIIHIFLSQRDDVETFSEGEENSRYLVVKKK
ncbi:MAG: KH domain-containing protein [Patescibacteria group bacterium]|nr:KH domain-containing protein [Patescibacteria group bacterium]